MTIFLKVVLFYSLHVFIFAQKLYPTNFNSHLRWGNSIVYGIDYYNDGEKDKLAFKNFVESSILNFTEIFDSPIVWTFEPNEDKLIKYDRFVKFHEAFEGCGGSSPSTRIVSDITISLGKNCEKYAPLKYILNTLGFQALEARIDRDQHIKILWENIPEPLYSSLKPYYHYANSTNKVFEKYDVGSINHYSMYAPFGKDPNSPIYAPVKEEDSAKLGIPNKDRYPTETDIATFRAIYPKN